MSKFILFYAKFSIDRKRQIKNHGTFFGAESSDLEDVKRKGMEISKEHPTLIIIPKTFPLNDTLDSIALDAQEHFEELETRLRNTQTSC